MYKKILSGGIRQIRQTMERYLKVDYKGIEEFRSKYDQNGAANFQAYSK